MILRKPEFTIEPVDSSVPRASAAGVEAFTSAQYGLSMHWGLYALLGHAEWVYYTERIPYPTYRALMEKFNPARFNAEEWADLMLESRQKFLTITSKHHDGFCMWDTALTDFKITNTPFKRDVLAELAKALRDRGLGLHFYYSLVDWTHPAYRNDWPAYVDYYQGQLRELLTNYGEIGGVIFDGYWPCIDLENDDERTYFQPGGLWDLQGTYTLIHTLQPNAVVANNAHTLPLPGEDYQVWELDMPGKNTVPFNTTDIGDLPTAVWWNLNTGWAYYPIGHQVKSPETILKNYREARSYDATFMLNVGPRPFGDIHPDEQIVLRKVGQLIREYRL